MKAISSLKNSISIIAIALLLPIAFSSCNSASDHSTASAPDTPKVAAPTAAAPDTPKKVIENKKEEAGQAIARVDIEHKAYNPASITVTKGTKVIWTDHQGIMPHTVTSDTKGLFDSGNMHKDDTFTHTFSKAGTYTYYCTHHGKMHGTVIVK